MGFALKNFWPRVGGRMAETVEDRSRAFGAVGGVSSTDWKLHTENVIREAEIVSETVSADDMGIDDCRGCTARSGLDCQRCSLFLEMVGKITLETVFTRPERPETLDDPVTVAPAISIPTVAASVPLRSRAAPAKKPSLQPREAAKQFLAHVRDTDKCGQYTHDNLRAAYYEFCDFLGCRPTAENHLRSAMQKQGVRKEKIWSKDSETGVVTRTVVWVIEPAETLRQPEPIRTPKRLGSLLAAIPDIQRAA